MKLYIAKIAQSAVLTAMLAVAPIIAFADSDFALINESSYAILLDAQGLSQPHYTIVPNDILEERPVEGGVSDIRLRYLPKDSNDKTPRELVSASYRSHYAIAAIIQCGDTPQGPSCFGFGI